MRAKITSADGDAKSKRGLFFDILRYLIDCPEARDTVEGIAQWWLLEQKIKRQVSQIQVVLESLVAMGLVLEQKGADQRPSYRVNSSRMDEIKKLLDGPDPEKEGEPVLG